MKIIGFILACLLVSTSAKQIRFLPRDVRETFRKAAGSVDSIKEYVLTGAGRHGAFDHLAFITDTFGSRMSGGQSLEDATDYALQALQAQGFDNVHAENVTVPKWIRGAERAELRLATGRVVPLKILGLGSSVGTPAAGITAEAIVVRSFDELEQVKDKVPGRIVVYNQPWLGSYGATNVYRSTGAERASAHGAVAALVRSVTQFSIDSPHTGHQNYGASPKIPVACITIEDGEMLQRWQDRGEIVTINLYMEAENAGDFIQRNVVAEITGTINPEQAVIFGGHYDSWDVGTGAMDDGGGAIIAWQALSVIKALDLKPVRTMRLILWTAEEQGLLGGHEYFNKHQDEAATVSYIMESDGGAFKPIGLNFTGSAPAATIMQGILDQLEDLNMSTLGQGGGRSSDTGDWVDAGVPGAELLSHNEDYFYYHHSTGDRMTVLDADDLDLCTILWAVSAYLVAELDKLLPR